MMQVKQGDWVWWEFKLCMVDNIRYIDSIKGLMHFDYRDGHFCYGAGRSENGKAMGECYPLSLRNKVISEEFYRNSTRVHKEGNNGLNYPDIHRHFVKLWHKACDLPEDDTEGLKKVYTESQDFTQMMIDASKYQVINGVRVFR